MAENPTDSTQETAPRPYRLLDGFSKASLLTKFLYAVTFPIGAVFIEGMEYQNAQNQIQQRQDKMLEDIRSRLQTTLPTAPNWERKANQQLSDTSSRFQDMIDPKGAPDNRTR